MPGDDLLLRRRRTCAAAGGGGTERRPPVTAHLEEDGAEEVALPYDADGNHIADAWEEDAGVSGQSGEVDDEQDRRGIAPTAMA